MTAFNKVGPRLRVRDVKLAAEWYRDRLGFVVGEYYPSPAGIPEFVIVQRGSVEIQLTLTPNDEALGNPDGTSNPGGAYFYVSDIDQLYDDIRRRNVDLLYELEDFPYGMREFALIDRDGHYLGFGQPVEV